MLTVIWGVSNVLGIILIAASVAAWCASSQKTSANISLALAVGASLLVVGYVCDLIVGYNIIWSGALLVMCLFAATLNFYNYRKFLSRRQNSGPA